MHINTKIYNIKCVNIDNERLIGANTNKSQYIGHNTKSFIIHIGEKKCVKHMING